jgi:hypothetical protein
VLLHIYRSLLVTMMGLGLLPTPFVFTLTSSFLLDLPAKALYTLTEAYDLKAAALVLTFVDWPAWFVFYSRLGVPETLWHTLGLSLWAGLLYTTVHKKMFSRVCKVYKAKRA